MEREGGKLDAEKIAELKKRGLKLLDEETVKKIAGGYYGEPSSCPLCGNTQLEVYAERIDAGHDAGRMEVSIFCPSCGYEDWYDF